MNLVIDIGNSSSKIGVFQSNRLIKLYVIKNLSLKKIYSIFKKHNIDSCILSSVKKCSKEVKKYLLKNSFFIELTQHTPVTIKNKYKTPVTLGKDRLAAAIGANKRFPNQTMLIIDSGSCITYDLVSKNTFYGGSITPGYFMRLKALNNFTDKLPLIKTINYVNPPGTTTGESILSGVNFGILSEAEGFISFYRKKYRNIKVILCGGNSGFLEKSLKNSIFVLPFLVLEGLNCILEYNLSRLK